MKNCEIFEKKLEKPIVNNKSSLNVRDISKHKWAGQRNNNNKKYAIGTLFIGLKT